MNRTAIYKAAAKKCFDSLLHDAAWTCDEQDDHHKAAMKCFGSLVQLSVMPLGSASFGATTLFL
jgi:hypothetical protein